MSGHDDQTGAGPPGGPERPRRPSRHKRASAPGSHEVGYGKPPQEHQFRPGQSGNPKGRPVGSKNKPPAMPTRIKDIILQEAYRSVPVRDGEEQVSMPIVQASLRAMGIRAVKGDTRAQWQLARLAQQAEAQQSASASRAP